MNVEALARRDRTLALLGLAGLTLLAWAFLVRMAREMAAHASMGMAMPMPAAWDAGRGLLTFLMWAIMMVAMMVPSAAPMIAIFATINRRRAESGTAAVPTAIFLAGYLVVWSAFSLVATLGQGALQWAALLSPSTLRAAPVAGGVLLLVAGAYQLTPLKYACLSRCQSPLGFVMTEWREGRAGAFVMGLRHGAFCVGCCWALMTLLFVAGVMNLLWVAALAALVLVEKVAPWPRAVSWAVGGILLGGGVWVLARGL